MNDAEKSDSDKYLRLKKGIVDLYHQAFCNSQGLYEMSWLGINTIQNPNDVWIIQELIVRLKPDFIIETGTWSGGSAMIWAMIQDQVNPRGRTITIDNGGSVNKKALPPIASKVDFIGGSSIDPRIVQDVFRRVSGGKGTLVILDSDHQKDYVLKEMEAYAPLVPVDGYMIVQDTDVNGHPIMPEFGPGPMEAIADFLRGRDDFMVDHEQERLLFTMHPGGYLRRVRPGPSKPAETLPERPIFNQERYWEQWDPVAASMDAHWASANDEALFRKTIVGILRPMIEDRPLGYLDVGCGNGLLVRNLLEAGVHPETVVGIDNSPRMIDFARKRVPGATFAIGDLFGLPYPSRSVDIVGAVNLLSYIPDIKSGLAELWRVASKTVFFTLFVGKQASTVNDFWGGSKFIRNTYTLDQVASIVKEVCGSRALLNRMHVFHFQGIVLFSVQKP